MLMRWLRMVANRARKIRAESQDTSLNSSALFPVNFFPARTLNMLLGPAQRQWDKQFPVSRLCPPSKPRCELGARKLCSVPLGGRTLDRRALTH